MIYLIVQRFDPNKLTPFRLFLAPTFQAAMAAVLAFFIVIVLGPRVIRWLRAQKIGDAGSQEAIERGETANPKEGTPTMGGLLIVSAIAASMLLLADLRNFYVQMATICLVYLAAVGAADDWLKLTVGRRSGSRQGLTSMEKLLFQLGLSVLLAYWTYHYGYGGHQSPPELYVPFFKEVRIPLGVFAFIVLGTLMMTGTSNAVNLSDGMDGLASGLMAIVAFAFCVLALIVGDRSWSHLLLIPHLERTDQMAVIAGAMTGACLGFLWYNCHPASVFMGDTGSLAMGGLMGYIALVIRQELLLVLVGGVFVMEAMSVLIQVSYFKYSRRRYGEGRRIFLRAPIHHHFQRKGWSETQTVVRFWLIGAMLAALALATIKVR